MPYSLRFSNDPARRTRRGENVGLWGIFAQGKNHKSLYSSSFAALTERAERQKARTKFDDDDGLELAQDEVATDKRSVTLAVSGAGLAAKCAVELSLVGGDSLDIVGEVVGSVARENLTTRHLSLGRKRVLAGRPHLVNATVVICINNGRDVEVGDVVPTLERDLTQHANSVGGILTDGEPVANPAGGEGDGLSSFTSHLNGGDLGVTNAGCKDNLAAGIVLADKGDSVSSTGDCAGDGSNGSDLGEELHLDCLFFVSVVGRT